MTKPTPTRREEVISALTKLGLTESTEWVDGFAFTYRKEPRSAVELYREQHDGTEASRFYAARLMFVLSE